MNKLPFISVVLTLFLSANLNAGVTQDSTSDTALLNNTGAFIHNFTHGGTGCPQGTADISLSEDNSQIDIYTYQYQAAADSVKQVRRNCAVAIGVTVPQNTQVALVSAHYSGYVDIAAGDESTLTAEYFEVGERGEIFTRKWYDADNAVAEDFEEQHVLNESQRIWSGCGENITLRANTSIKVENRDGQGRSRMGIDRRDQPQEVAFQLLWRACH